MEDVECFRQDEQEKDRAYKRTKSPTWVENLIDGEVEKMDRRGEKWKTKDLPIDNEWMMNGRRDSFRQGGWKNYK